MKKHFTLIATLVFTALSAYGRDGVFIEYKMTGGNMTGNNKTYSSEGDSRSEMTIQSPSLPGGMNTVTLILHNDPTKIYMLSEKDKTYSEMDATKSMAEHREDDDYEVTVLGKEKINEYNCTHVRVLNKRSQHTSEMWLSKDVKGYAGYAEVKTKYFGGSKFFKTLKEKGAEGFVVRVLIKSERTGGSMQMDLIKIEKQQVAESLFSLSGYTKGASTYPGQMQGVPGMKKSTEEIQEMTPDERNAYIEQLKQQYQKH